MICRAAGKIFVWASLGLVWGCSPELRALPGDGVVLIDGDKAAVAEAAGVTIFARGADVPWSRRGEPAGVFLEITNGGASDVAFDLERVALVDSQGLRRLPDSPVQMIEAFQAAEADRRPMRVAISVSYGYPHGHYPHHFHGPYYFDDPWDDRDGYERAERAKFLSRLLTSRTIRTQEVISGYVVFPFRLRKDETVVLEVTLAAASPTSSPADSPSGPVEMRFAFDFIVK